MLRRGLVMFGALALGRQRQCERQQQACRRHHPRLEFATHHTLSVQKPPPAALRGLLIGINIRLYLQIVEQIKIRVQVFVLVERLQIAHCGSPLDHYR